MPSATPPLLDALRDLADLSRLDSELRALEIEKTEFPARVVACAERRSSSEARLAASRERVTEVEQEQRRQEGEARDQEALLEKLEAQQHQVKTNKEYSALLLEMERAREAISTAETSVLEAMEALETARLGLADGEREVASLLEGIAEEERGIEARSHSVQETIEELRVRRGGVGNKLDSETLARYEKLAARIDSVVVVVSGESCKGCRVGIPPQSYIEILRGETLVSCGQCRRILIHSDHLQA